MRQSRIVLFEDDPYIAESTRLGLECLGHKVLAVFAAANEALASLAELKPDLVLMDIDLEGSMDGIEAATEIHNRFGIPVIFTTGHEDEPTIQRAVETESFGYVVKPYAIKDLKAAVEMALYRAHRDKERNEILENTVRR